MVTKEMPDMYDAATLEMYGIDLDELDEFSGSIAGQRGLRDNKIGVLSKSLGKNMAHVGVLNVLPDFIGDPDNTSSMVLDNVKTLMWVMDMDMTEWDKGDEYGEYVYDEHGAEKMLEIIAENRITTIEAMKLQHKILNNMGVDIP